MTTLNRRQLLVAGLAITARGAQPKAAKPVLDRGFASVTELAPGVYATIADITKGLQAASNGGVIAGRTGVILIEGHMQPAGAALEIEAARLVSKAPIRGAINTHYHYDHTFGNLAYAQQQIPIMAHEKAVDLMKERYEKRKGVDHRPLLEPLERRIAEAKDETDRKRKQGDLTAWKLGYDLIDAANLAFPTQPLGARELPKRMDLGGLTAVIEFHPGHSGTDLTIRVPEREVVFAGDLLFNGGYPVALDADMIEWRKTLDKLASYGRRARFVPGHAGICGIEAVREQTALFDDLRAHAEKMRKAGATVDEAERRYVVPERFKSYRIRSWGFSVGAAMQSYYRATP